jgi:hypothetical protein
MMSPSEPVVMKVSEIDSTIYQYPIAWAWINNVGKMSFLFQGRYTAYVENISCRGLEGVGEELENNIFGRHEKLLNGIHQASFFQ